MSSASAAPDDGFIRLAGGSFMMGSPVTERQRADDETRHAVPLAPFYVDPYEVTQGDWERLMGENPSASRGSRLPVENVTWLEAVRYCNALSLERGLEPAYVIDCEAVVWNRRAGGYRLLTEAEREYAARAGTQTIFSGADQVNGDTVNFEGSYPYLIEENYVTRRDPAVRTGRVRGHVIAVDELSPNAFGLHHMHGNVSEWVFDYYGAYESGPAVNPAGPAEGTYRVNRGGSFLDFAKHLRCAHRSAANPLAADPGVGFRLARNAVDTAELEADVLATGAPWRVALPERPRVLVAVFSYSGNTRRAARAASRLLDCDLFEIRMREPYRGNIYEVTGQDLNSGRRPPLSSAVPDLDQYNVILLGYPTWWATMPMPVLTFLESADIAGKIILPFSSHGGTVWGDSVSDLAKAAPGAYVGLGFEFHYSGGRSLERDVEAWLERSGLLR